VPVQQPGGNEEDEFLVYYLFMLLTIGVLAILHCSRRPLRQAAGIEPGKASWAWSVKA
jgi:hypothetical protein